MSRLARGCAPLLTAGLVLGLAACATGMPPHDARVAAQPGAPAQAYTDAGEWEGRLSLKLDAHGQEAARGASMGFVLRGHPGEGRLELSTPMGTQMAAVRWQAREAVLQTADGTRTYASLDELTLDLLGEALPLRAMMSWLRGTPDPSQPWEAEGGGERPDPSRFRQAGWLVDLREHRDGVIQAVRAHGAGQRGAALKVRLLR